MAINNKKKITAVFNEAFTNHLKIIKLYLIRTFLLYKLYF